MAVAMSHTELISNEISVSMSTNQQHINADISASKEPFLSRSECNIMRGFAILFIIVENVTHLFKGVFMDNEFLYKWSAVDGFLNNLTHPDSLLPFNLISFYCPYGVILFIFLSGYCLTLKYEKGNGRGTSTKSFIGGHYQKLFVMQLKGLALYLFVLFMFYPDEVVPKSIIYQFLLVGNLKPSWQCIPFPYWFFGMIMEMYVIYRLVIYNRKDWVAIALTVLSVVVMAFFEPTSDKLHYLRLNCFLAIMPFCMGVLAARHLNAGSLSLNKTSACIGWFLLAFVLLTACKFSFYSWLILPIFVLATAVPLMKLLMRVRLFVSAFSWLGAMSGVLFVIHPTVREILIDRINISGNFYGMLIVNLFVTFGISMILKPAFTNKKKEK